MLKGEYCLKAIRAHQMDYGLIFCRTKLDCDNMEAYLTSNGNVSCVCLHGDRKPQERRDNLQLFKERKVNFLICTDVAARGIDVSKLPFMINVMLPDDKANYVHRIGRVGRAERMGLAVSLVASHPEKVWYHGQWCKTKGRGCTNTRLLSEKGCCIWFDERQMLADIEEHLGVTVAQIGRDMRVEVDEFDGKVVYGKKREDKGEDIIIKHIIIKKLVLGTGYVGHAGQMKDVLKLLQELEQEAQLCFLQASKA